MSDLYLNEDNPRLAEISPEGRRTQDDIIHALWEKMAVEELAMSIAYNGYFDHEPLFIEKRKGGGWTVIEGNRRLAAVKILLDPSLRKRLRAQHLPKLDAAQQAELSTLPAVETTEKEVWRYLGFKHVNGPSTWGSYAKAQYIARVRNDFKVRLEDIARQIGDYANTVERMYRGLMVVEQAEELDVFDRNATSKGAFYFNYIYTSLDNPNYREFLNLADKSRDAKRPVPKSHHRHLGELMTWLYGDKRRGKTSLIKSQNPDLKRLGVLLTDAAGVEALREGHTINEAEEISAGDERLFRRALFDAKKALTRAYGTVATGFVPGDREAVDLATDVETLATDLRDEIRRREKVGRDRSSKRAD